MSAPFFDSLPPRQFDADIAHLESRLDEDPDDRYAAAWLFRVLDFYTPETQGLGAYADCQREIVARYDGGSWPRTLLDIEKAAEHYHFWNGVIDARGLQPPTLVTQLFAGQIIRIHGEQSNCTERMTLFRKQGVISGFCHDCYKVQILPEDLSGLIRTYFVLRELDLPRDNARKCMVELRGPVPYPYKGYIFCES